MPGLSVQMVQCLWGQGEEQVEASVIPILGTCIQGGHQKSLSVHQGSHLQPNNQHKSPEDLCIS